MMKKNNEKSVDDTSIKVLSFFLNQELYAIPVTDIREINRMSASTIKTLKNGIMMGLLNLHGSATCILNLKQILESNPFDLNPTPGWIAVKSQESIVCLAVDTFFRFMEISDRNLSTIPVLKEQPDSEKIKFYARVDDNLIPVLDINYIINLFKTDNHTTEKLSPGSPLPKSAV